MTPPHPLFEPVFTNTQRFPTIGWRIGVRNHVDCLVGSTGKNLVFGCRADVVRAIEAFRVEGYLTREDFHDPKITDAELRRIATQNLMW